MKSSYLNTDNSSFQDGKWSILLDAGIKRKLYFYLTLAVPGQNAGTPVDHSRAFAIVCSKWLLLWIQVGKHTNFCCFNTQKLVEKPMQSKVSDTHTILCMCSILVSSSYQGRDNRLLLRCIHLSPSELFWMVSVNLEYWIMSLLRVLEPSQSYEWSPKFLILN